MKDSVTGKRPTKKNKEKDGVPKMALPFYSVDTLQEAQDLQLLLCKLNYDGRYILPNFGGELEDLEKAATLLKNHYLRMKSRRQ